MTNLFINLTTDHTYKDGLAKWSTCLSKPTLDTVYITALDEGVTPRQILAAVDDVKEYFDLSDKTEMTLECDPEGLSLIYLRSFYGEGITRLSMARPTCEHLIEGFSFFDSVNVDGRFFEGASHISRYDLNDFEQFEQVRLALAGAKFFPYDRYHFCQPGAVCQYLKNVLEYRPYIGVGPHAHGRLKIDDQWISVIEGEEKTLSDQAWMEEFMLQNLSLYPGIDGTWCEQITGRAVHEFFDAKQWQEWIDTKVIDFVGNRTHLSGETFFTPEKIVAELKL